MPNGDINSHIDELYKLFDLTRYGARAIVANFHEEMDRGLQGHESSLKMLPAFVDVATGTEKGTYLALDLGGTNFRVLQVALDGNCKASVKKAEKFVIPKAVMGGTGLQLFNFIAGSIQKFVSKHKIALKQKKQLGFTFSFPINQKTIANGILINWTKGFSASGVVGKNVVKLLQDSLLGYGIKNIEIVALANDTVGTLAAKSYVEADCDVGVIFGTGTNACYREKTKTIRKLPRRSAGKSKYMVVNTEWGNFHHLRRNKFDIKLDKATNNPGQQIMEKMISGMYLGEITRLVISDLIKKKVLFTKSKTRFGKDVFKTSHMSLIQSDCSKNMARTREYLESIGILHTTTEEMLALKKICRAISTRAARISAAALSAVVEWMDPELLHNHTIGIDGTLYERYPGFRRNMRSLLNDMHGEKGKRIKLVRAKDGSGIGVAVVAAVTSHKKR